jgi:uncharacterized Zn finger protein (UPF0148 family)
MLMSQRQCPGCGKTISVETGAAFCPFCGAILQKTGADSDRDAVREALKQAEAQPDPKKRYALLTRAQQEYPDNLAVAEELLLLGRLHERDPRKLDFSVIKSYLLNAYLEPQLYTPEQSAAMRRELFEHPDLERCLALAEDRNAFLSHYLTRLSNQFIELFLKGSSQYMRRFFGFGLDSRAPKLLSYPAARMLKAMRGDPLFSEEQRLLLARAFYRSFSAQMGEDTQWLDKAMAEQGVSLA